MSNKKKTTKEYLISGDNYFPNTEATRTHTLPAGAYECNMTMEGQFFLTPIDIVTDTIVDIPNMFTGNVIKEIQEFWSEGVSEKFKQYGLVQKRGILLHGQPGTGKTICLAKAAKTVIEDFGGVVLFNPDPGLLKEYVRVIKDIEPNKKILVMWEEFDSLLMGSESTLLSLLDGEIQVGNIVYLATTNYISKIPSRIKNRPSRFARIIEVSTPDAEARRAFLNAKLHTSDLDKLEPMVEASDGFVIDQLKDLIVSVCCFGYNISESVLKIKEMQEDSVGYDDYQEQQAQNVFKQNKLGSNRFGHKPIRPLR